MGGKGLKLGVPEGLKFILLHKLECFIGISTNEKLLSSQEINNNNEWQVSKVLI